MPCFRQGCPPKGNREGLLADYLLELTRKFQFGWLKVTFLKEAEAAIRLGVKFLWFSTSDSVLDLLSPQQLPCSSHSFLWNFVDPLCGIHRSYGFLLNLCDIHRSWLQVQRSVGCSFSSFFFWCSCFGEIIFLVVSGCEHAFKTFDRITMDRGDYYDYYKQNNSQCLECTLEPWSPTSKPIKIKSVKERPCCSSHPCKPRWLAQWSYVIEFQLLQKC